MARYVFFSFSYDDVRNFRVNVVRKSWVLNNGERTFIDGSIWETAKTKGELALMNLIENGINQTSVTAILIGDNTAYRRWVKYEIVKSFCKGNGILAVHINRIRAKTGKISCRGNNPLERLGFLITKDGRKIQFYELNSNKWEVYNDLREVRNRKSNSLFFDDHWWHGNSYGKFYRFSEKFPTKCWDFDGGYQNFTSWVETAAKQVGR